MDKSLQGLPVGWKIEKQGDGSTKVFMPTPTGFVEVDQDAVDSLMDRLAGKGEDATREPMYSPTQFTSGDALGRPVLDAPKPPETYGFSEPGLRGVRLGNNWTLAPIDPGIADPEPFGEPEPGRDPADGPAPVDFATDVSPIFKRAGRKVAPGTFKGTASDVR